VTGGELKGNRNGINRINNDDRGRRAPRAHEIPLAGTAAEFLAADYDNSQRDNLGSFREFHDDPESDAAGDTLVSGAFPCLSLPIPSALSILCLDRIEGRMEGL
jgi:hypothetical protein